MLSLIFKILKLPKNFQHFQHFLFFFKKIPLKIKIFKNRRGSWGNAQTFVFGHKKDG